MQAGITSTRIKIRNRWVRSRILSSPNKSLSAKRGKADEHEVLCKIMSIESVLYHIIPLES